jgi:cell wall-associated NlpC family hydrolase
LELVRNYYKNELNIIIGHYVRDDSWHKDNPKIISENFEREGFRKVSQYHARKHDVILFGKGEDIYHIGIYLDNSLMLHHPRDGRSVIEYLNLHWTNQISSVVRHRSYE